ncbi:MAG: endonuclease/exonuclease/phosphatase family protein [Phycisphaerales bacterium]|jgi:endonuclease/exonuclease/phosphatase family metal-dependent hydrolase|nr:endonuclease/exonuclease/phosphatase family protein [Phycisphaerales bacterium]
MFIPTIALLVAAVAVPSPHHKFGLTEAMPRIDGTIRVASYNMLNFFDQVNDPLLEGKYDDYGDNPGPTSLERCEELAKVIRKLDADILALQEVESLDALEWFNEKFLPNMGYQCYSEDVGYYRGIEQSVLTRFPIKETLTWKDADLTKIERTGGGWTDIPADRHEISFQRSPLCATVETPSGYELTLFIVHQKSGRNAWHRELEALQIMQYIKEMNKKNPNRNIMVLGDFNAQPWDRSLRVYFRDGMTDALSIRSLNMEWDDLSPLRKTHTSDRMLDYMLLNPAVMDEYVIDSGFVLGSSAEDYNWMEQPPPAGYASDHCAVSIDLVPINGMGTSVKASKWPESVTKTALNAIPTVPKKPTVTTPSNSPEPAAPDTAPFLASKRSKVFHKSSCGNAKRISEKNLTGYSTFSDASNSGRNPAKCCKPTE